MTTFKELQMEQKIQELEMRVSELENLSLTMGKVIASIRGDKEPSNIPQDIVLGSIYECRSYLENLGYIRVTSMLYLSKDKRVRAIIKPDGIYGKCAINFSV